jgi:hypothetical protein
LNREVEPHKAQGISGFFKNLFTASEEQTRSYHNIEVDDEQ